MEYRIFQRYILLMEKMAFEYFVCLIKIGNMTKGSKRSLLFFNFTGSGKQKPS